MDRAKSYDRLEAIAAVNQNTFVSGGLVCVAGTFLVALAVPAFIRYEARAPA